MCERAPHIIVCYGEKLKYEREKKNHRPDDDQQSQTIEGKTMF